MEQEKSPLRHWRNHCSVMLWIADCRNTTIATIVHTCECLYDFSENYKPQIHTLQKRCCEGNTHGSMLTGVASLIADRTGGVMSQLSKKAATQSLLSGTTKNVSHNQKFYQLFHTDRQTYWIATGCVLLIWGLQEVAAPGCWLQQLQQMTGKWRSRGQSLHEQGWGLAEACKAEWWWGCRQGERGSAGGSGRVWCWSRQEGQWINWVLAAGWRAARAVDVFWPFCRHHLCLPRFPRSSEKNGQYVTGVLCILYRGSHSLPPLNLAWGSQIILFVIIFGRMIWRSA